MSILETQVKREGEKLITFRGQDVEPLKDKMAHIRNNQTKEEAHKKSMHFVGTIPAVLVEYLHKNGINLLKSKDMQRYVISHPDLSDFKCYQGQVRKPILTNTTKSKLDKLIKHWSAQGGIV